MGRVQVARRSGSRFVNVKALGTSIANTTKG